MTVSYNLDVSSGNSLTFFKLLLRWKGSIFKSVWLELLFWIAGYFGVFIIYRFCLNPDGQRTFERISDHLDVRLEYIPLTFMLGFFVSSVCDRWKQVIANLPFIEASAVAVSSVLRGTNEEMRLRRRAIIRYLVLTQILVFRDISVKVRRRFPNMESIVDAGFLFEDELEQLKNIKIVYNKYWVPVNWALQHVYASYKDWDRTKKDVGMQAPPFLNVLATPIQEYRNKLENLCKYDWIPLPIAYPQVVFLAVRSYFMICMVSRQFHLKDSQSDRTRTQIDLFFPLMTVIQFVFVVGWMKVAEALLNPLGEDDDDLECNWLIDKNIATGMAIVDEEFNNLPALRMDPFVDHTFKPVYPQDEVEDPQPNNPGSAATIKFASEDKRIPMVHVDNIDPDLSPKKASDASILTQRRGFLGRKRSSAVVWPVDPDRKRSSAGYLSHYYLDSSNISPTPPPPSISPNPSVNLTTLNEHEEILRKSSDESSSTGSETKKD